MSSLCARLCSVWAARFHLAPGETAWCWVSSRAETAWSNASVSDNRWGVGGIAWGFSFDSFCKGTADKPVTCLSREFHSGTSSGSRKICSDASWNSKISRDKEGIIDGCTFLFRLQHSDTLWPLRPCLLYFGFLYFLLFLIFWRGFCENQEFEKQHSWWISVDLRYWAHQKLWHSSIFHTPTLFGHQKPQQ